MSRKSWAITSLLSIATLAGLVLAAVPLHAGSPPEPTYGMAIVDGDTGEWDLGADFFANMYRAGKADQPPESKLYLRHDCSNSTLYTLVLSEPDAPVLANLPADSYVKLGNTVKLVDGNSAENGTPPDFTWVGLGFDGDPNHAQGWEASALLAPASYTNLNVNAQVYDDGSAQMSAVSDRAISLVLNCSMGSTLSLVKQVVNSDGGTLTSLDVPVYVDGLPGAWTTMSLAPGLHTVTESAQPGYASSVWGGDCSPEGTVTLGPGDSKTCTITNDDYHFGGFVECVRPEADGYWVRFGYRWDGAAPIDLARSDLSPAIAGVTMPLVFEPGRHLLDDIFVPHSNNVVWTFGPEGFEAKTATASNTYSKLCYAYCNEPAGDDWTCTDGLEPYEGVCRNPSCLAETNCVCPSAAPRYELGGRVWYDTDRDGIQDGGEPGVHGVVARLYGNGNCTGSALARRTTDLYGRYIFTNLPAGTYCVAFSNLPDGWKITLRNQGADNVDSDANRASGQIGNLLLKANDRNEDMGLYVDGSIGDRVWCDRNLNARYDGGEGIGNVTVWLYADNNCDGREDKLLGSATTAANGLYSFPHVAAGPLRSRSQFCYVVKVNTSDKDLRTCKTVFTERKFGVLLNANHPSADDADFGFKERASDHGQFVPEPGALVLLGSGLSILAGYAGWRHKR